VFDEGAAHGHEAIRIAEALDHPLSVLVGCLDLAHLKSIRGKLSQAVGLLERGVAQRKLSSRMRQSTSEICESPS